MMEMAKVTSKGQITIPISIRRRLGINEGDKILFINKIDGVMMVNPDTVQGDIADITADAVSIDTPVSAAPPAAAAKTATPAPAPVAPAPAVQSAPVVKESEAPAAISIDTPAPVSEPIEPPKRKYIPPVEDDFDTKPAKAGGIDLSTLLDDIRSIGSNI